MNINFKSLLCAISDALDYTEGSLTGATQNHAKRVAYMSAMIGKTAGLTDSDLADLSACALLHDNALTEYIHNEQDAGINILLHPDHTTLGSHCSIGERNISAMPFYPRIKDVILYHHERPDRKGPFRKLSCDIPLYSRIIHLADLVDIGFPPQKSGNSEEEPIRGFINKFKNIYFDSDIVNLFSSCINDGIIAALRNENVEQLLDSAFPAKSCIYGKDEIISVATIFAKIIDYKSPFTSTHSTGIAQKALLMSVYYGWDDETQAEFYLTGALHDIGKLTIETDILEKPAKLTDGEYKRMQFHAYATWEMLRKIEGFEQITEWASYHHEKLDGSGYPFGKTADELSYKSRLMACLDIYQALTENRPYRKEMTHEDAMKFLINQTNLGKLDPGCVKDINACLGRNK
jgi:HD-GYP domain-containing protein (c-di-GMP phosphodiesterase class II)